MDIETILNETSLLKTRLINMIVGELQMLITRNITAIRWEQYTPYFNDGSECHFHVYEPSLLVDNETVYSYSMSHKYESTLTTIEDIILSDELTDIMLFLFGDHVQVTVYKNSYTIDPYDHE